MANARYYLMDDYGTTGGAGASQQRLSPDFSAPSVTIATNAALVMATALQRPVRLVPIAGAPPFTLVNPQLPAVALTNALSGIGY
ncbi:MAG TPA: hypothetical protein VGI39_39675 [Polyangiaceae bacterium]|jgi:hypothetical protein